MDTANRAHSGLFQRGQSGNPSGRPKVNPDLRLETRAACFEVIQTWLEILRDKKAKDSDRIKAGENIWAVAYGKPSTSEPEPPQVRPIVIPSEFIE